MAEQRQINRRRFVKAAAASAAAAACGSAAETGAAAVQARPRVVWRLASSFPRGLDTLYGAAEVMAVEERTVTFRVEARDEREVIGGGTHQRVVVNVARFDARVQRKLRPAE